MEAENHRVEKRRPVMLFVDWGNPWVRDPVIAIISGFFFLFIGSMYAPGRVVREGVWATVHVERVKRFGPTTRDRIDANGDSRNIPSGYALRLAISTPEGFWWIAAALPKNDDWHFDDISLRNVRDAPGAPIYSGSDYEIHVLMATPDIFANVPRTFSVDGDRLPRDMIDLARTAVERNFL